ncbi:hypothetical protein EX30DRAFT_342501 [Ascodesmis nigricans]|uniref:Uncharacterized protein n=1 Tax=Ascodesmis nigricans TaxID=341454 RepID=A0A4S2MQ45_9PEZI|nr:hypothetical protein EX30DRAFT_342501 [Ascodesmis nigricans]
MLDPCTYRHHQPPRIWRGVESRANSHIPTPPSPTPPSPTPPSPTPPSPTPPSPTPPSPTPPARIPPRTIFLSIPLVGIIAHCDTTPQPDSTRSYSSYRVSDSARRHPGPPLPSQRQHTSSQRQEPHPIQRLHQQHASIFHYSTSPSPSFSTRLNPHPPPRISSPPSHMILHLLPPLIPSTATATIIIVHYPPQPKPSKKAHDIKGYKATTATTADQVRYSNSM